MAIIVTKWFGVFLIDEKTNKIIDKRLMPQDTNETAKKLAFIQKGAILQEERDLAKDIPKLTVSDRRQSELGKTVLYDSSFIKPESFGFTNTIMHEVMLKLGKLRTSEPIAKDKNLVQAIRALDDATETANLLDERLHEWYGMHFPELADQVKDQRYAALVAKFGEREGIIKELDLDVESIGSDFDLEDMKQVTELAQTLCEIYANEQKMREYITAIVDDICPNMCAILGGPLSARMISLAGGLQRLASLPSSTVQLLGAEKAMFRHLKSGKNPPKHGVLYQHPDIHRSPYWQRGNIARALAGKVLIAAKIDAYKGEFKGNELNKEFEERVTDIKRRYPNAPKKKPISRGRNRKGANKPRKDRI